MAASAALENFPQKTVSFLKKLSKNNNRDWFESHRDDYNTQFLAPAFQLVVDVGEKLSTIVPNINAIPKIDKSVFRLHRDVRFSKDKSPYKTNLGIYFWEGKKKLASSGFYFHLDTKRFFIGTGIFMLSGEQLKIFRNAVSNPALGKELNTAVKKVMKKGNYLLGGKNYKKTPRGYDPESQYADYLLHNGFYMHYENTALNELIENDPVQVIFKTFKNMLPVHQWLVENLK